MTFPHIKQVLLTALLAVSLPALAEISAANPKKAQPLAEDPVIEVRLVTLAAELRCVVCQNETIAHSPAELAVDMRRDIRAQMKAGKNDKEIIDYLLVRYGDFVLYRPPFKPVTYLLWLGPVLFLGIGSAAWVMALRRRRAMQNTPPDENKLAAAAKLLAAQPLEENK